MTRRAVTPLIVAVSVLALGLGDVQARAASNQGQRQAAPTSAPASPAPASAASPQQGPPSTDAATSPKSDEFKLEGFRSARFGMNEAQVRAAIKKDFPNAADKIAVERNGAERTTALAVTVDDLLPDSGPARVAYILGYRSKQLIQVNVVWGEPLNPDTTTEALLATANSLSQYFRRLDFRRESMAVNTRMSDGSIVVFRGADNQNRLVLLRLLPTGVPAEKTGEPPRPRALWLSYIRDAQNPDVFRIERGQF